MYTKVKPGLYHQFEVLETGVAFELYWAEFNHNDILRESTGYYDIESLVDKDEGTNDIIIRVSDDKIDDWDDTGNYGEGC